MKSKIPICVSSLALETLIRGGRFPPKPVRLSGPEVTIGIVEGQKVPVQLVQQVGMVILVLHELIEHPGVDSRGDPLPGVDAAVNPHGGLFATAALAYLAVNHEFICLFN